MKKCGKCKKFLEEYEFSIHKNKLQSFCKQCQSEYAKEYRKKNPKVLIENLREWRKRNTSERVVTEDQKLRDELRAKVRRLLAKDSDVPDSVLGYSPKELKNYLLKNYKRLPSGNFCLKYKIPLNKFDLSNIQVWQSAAALENIEIFEKNS